MRAAEYELPAGLVAELDANLRAQGFSDRLDEVLDELTEIRRECGWPPLASPIGQVLGSQALIHVLSAQRWQIVVDEIRDLIEGRYGRTPAEVDPVVVRALGLLPDHRAGDDGVPDRLDELREDAEGLAASEEELLLLALFGEEAEPLLRAVRSRGRRDAPEGAGLDRLGTERLRELIRVVQESGIGEVTVEEGETRVTVRRREEASEPEAGSVGSDGDRRARRPRPTSSRPPTRCSGSSRRWSAPSTAPPSPGSAPFVEEGDVVTVGQTLCILEAMKLMNEVKADHDGRVRRICVENEHPVQYGDLLFELEPLNGRPLDAL